MLFGGRMVEKARKLIEKDAAINAGWYKFSSRMYEIDGGYILRATEKCRILRENSRIYGGNKRYSHGNYLRELSEISLNLAFAAVMNEDENLSGYARALMLLICEEEAWVFQGISLGWRSDLWTSDIGRNVAIAFDLIRSKLRNEDIETITDSIYRKSFLPVYEEWLDPVKRIHSLDTMGHNWWNVCVSGIGIVLLSLGEELDNYNKYLDEITEGLEEWFRYSGNTLLNKRSNFGEAGDFIEYAGYLDYALSSFVIFDHLLGGLCGTGRFNDIAFLKKVPDFYVNTCYFTKTGFKSFGFGDIKASRSKHSYVWLYLADRYKRGDMLSYCKSMKEYLDNALDFVFYPADVKEKAADLPGMKIFNHSGYAIIRDGSETNAAVFAMKTGESWNHNHRDIGSYILVCNGNEYIVDSGTCKYSDPLYTSYYKAPAAHNIILKDNAGQREEMEAFGTKFDGGFPVFLDSPGYKYLLADCTGPYCDNYQRFYRHIMFFDKIIIMVDDLFANSPGAFQWLLHYKGDLDTFDGGISIKNGDELKIFNLFPVEKEYITGKGYLPEDESKNGEPEEKDYIKIGIHSDDRRVKFINLFALPYEENRGISVERIESGKVHGVRITKRDSVDEIYCNIDADGRVMHKNANMSFELLETDGFLCCISFYGQGNIRRISLHNGSYIKYNGICYFSSLLKSDVVLEYIEGFKCHAVMRSDAWCYFNPEGSNAIIFKDKGKTLVKRHLIKGNNLFAIGM